MSTAGKAKERAPARKVTPPSAGYMSNDQFANYLADLRSKRIARPGGARPLPSSGSSSRRDPSRTSFGASAAAADSLSGASVNSAQQPSADVSAAAPSAAGRPSLGTHPVSASHSVSGSISSRYSTVSGRGRDYYPDKAAAPVLSRPLRPDEVVPTDTYMERGQRWMEKEEAVSLRQALEDLDLQRTAKTTTAAAAVPAPSAAADADEQRIYAAALDEAAELVWQHQHGVKPPEPGAPYQYKRHLRKNSYAYARTASVGRYGDDIEPTGLARDPAARSVSGSSSSSTEAAGSQRSRYSFGSSRVVSGGSGGGSGSGSSSARQSLEKTATQPASAATAATAAGGSLRSKAYGGLAGGPRPMVSTTAAASSRAAGRRRSSMKRNISGEIEKPFSGDQIYEEPETATPEKRVHAAADGGVLQAKPETVVNSKDPAPGASAGAGGLSKLVSRFEIHRNPPSQSRNPQYTTNAGPQQAQQAQQEQQSTKEGSTAAAAASEVPRKNGVEIRSDDIRQATSMKLKDRSAKLPTPAYVSDRPGRPIVSFDANWKAPVAEAATDARPDARETRCGGSGGVGGSSRDDSNPRNVFAGSQGPPPALAITSPAASGPAPSVSPQQYQQQHQQHHQQQQHHPHHQPPQQPQQRPQARNIFDRARARPVTAAAAGPVVPAIPTISVTEEPAAPASPQPRPPVPIPTISVSEEPTTTRAQPPQIPTIVLPGEDEASDAPSGPPSDIPSILIPGHDAGRPKQGPAASAPPPVPVIVTPDGPSSQASAAKPSTRPLPTPANVAAGGRPRGHWSRAPVQQGPSGAAPSVTGSVAGSRATARCHECRYPIEGRFIALAGLPGVGSSGTGSERFHPQCFRCYTCGTSLEALEISPEPDSFRNARLHRIARRQRGEILEEAPGETMAEDGDERLRFYCHLDWHEQFAPRCKHCTTPIVGEHVVALGAHWHVGHFFCAECGDPFGPGATHIEKDGYAWCVSCQTRRTERRAPKCRACGKAVIGQYVQALAAEWHDDCFRCAVCSGGFVDGQIFPREGRGGQMQVVCTGCRQRELKA